MKRFLAVVVMVVVFAFSFMVAASATPQVAQAPSWLLVIRVDSYPNTPTSTPSTITTIFHVTYPGGPYAVTLDPLTASFLWSGSNGWQREFDNVRVFYTGNPGFYTSSILLTQAIVQAAGPGLITISVVAFSLSDAAGSRGPRGNVNSLITTDPTDNSQIQVASAASTTMMTTQPSGLSATEDVILLIAALLVAALLLARSRGKKK